MVFSARGRVRGGLVQVTVDVGEFVLDIRLLQFYSTLILLPISAIIICCWIVGSGNHPFYV